MNCLFLAQGFPIYVDRQTSRLSVKFTNFLDSYQEAVYILKMCKQFDISHYSWYIAFKKENNYNISIEINKIQKFLVLKGCAKYTKRSLTNKNNKAVHCTIIRPNNNKATKGQLISN